MNSPLRRQRGAGGAFRVSCLYNYEGEVISAEKVQALMPHQKLFDDQCFSII